MSDEVSPSASSSVSSEQQQQQQQEQPKSSPSPPPKPKRMDAEVFLQKCKDFGLTVFPWEEYANQSIVSVSPVSLSPSASQSFESNPAAVLAGKIDKLELQEPSTSSKNAMMCLNELAQVTHRELVHDCVTIGSGIDVKYKHTVIFGDFSATAIECNKRKAKAESCSHLMQILPEQLIKRVRRNH